MTRIKLPAALLMLGALVGCSDLENGQYTTTAPESATRPAAAVATAPVTEATVQIFEGTPDRAYTVLGPLDISVNKLTAFHPTPTRADATARLQKEAAKLGANAVINVVIGEPRPVPLSWSARKATGTAVKF